MNSLPLVTKEIRQWRLNREIGSLRGFVLFAPVGGILGFVVFGGTYGAISVGVALGLIGALVATRGVGERPGRKRWTTIAVPIICLALWIWSQELFVRVVLIAVPLGILLSCCLGAIAIYGEIQSIMKKPRGR